jgi:GNAT superfamily N-acetyltransferase
VPALEPVLHERNQMSETHAIIVEPPDILRKQLLEGLNLFNERAAGPYNDQPLSLAVRNHDGTLIGGLLGLSYWNMLHVDLLWVHEDHRRAGCGTALLTRAEEVAAQRGCEVIFLNTYGFQAPGFYAKRGYTAFGVLTDAPKGSETTWFAKRLAVRP